MYLASNANLTSYGAGWRIWLLAAVAKALGVLIHVEGIPFGASRRSRSWTDAKPGENPIGLKNYPTT